MRAIPPRAIAGLYAIVDPAACAGREAVAIARLALEGGARVLQWRDKARDKGDQLADARALARACQMHGALFIVNDHIDLALAAEADGVHLGQHDLPIEAVRPFALDLIIGVSTNNIDEARAAEAGGADYIAVGAVYPTKSKETTRPADLERVAAIRAAVRVPVVAIGGIDASNVRDVVAAGADAVAVIRAICGAPDPRAAAAELASAFESRDYTV